MNDTSIIEKRVLMAEISALEREYKNIQKQMKTLQTTLDIIMQSVKVKSDKIQAIAEEHSIIEYKYLSENNL
jgi:hypothetical protein